MLDYRYEMHAHTADVSICARIMPETLIEEYSRAGYAGIVITNHMNQYTFLNQNLSSWKSKVDYFLKGYHRAKKAAGKKIQVFLGMELTFYNNDNDYLVYGLDEEFLYKHGDLMAMDLPSFSQLAHEHDLVIFQAHPFRERMTIVNPSLLDGIEVYNGNPRHDSRNDIARLWAQKYHLHTVSGSDCHQIEDVAIGGIVLPNPAGSIQDIVQELMFDRAKLIEK